MKLYTGSFVLVIIIWKINKFIKNIEYSRESRAFVRDYGNLFELILT